ncbi:hypothetical protein PR202_ga31243 [Eleusine coracana subsp. coracana]|uniref:Uncharacterized protein n=1 Tax=Eleusine coracana subsp. coracana TaxID=191504 RepID=A0AAV5DQW2_ELECO|nr:hypothetical protein PR202_ga31243 [Eleusine coracana subsp. coracana]
MHATMQAMQQELATLRQAVLNASTGGATVGTRGVAATCNIPTVGAIATGAHQEPIPVSGISLMHWIDMKLDHVDGSGSLVDAVDWLTYVEDKIEVFEVVYGDRVRYGT